MSTADDPRSGPTPPPPTSGARVLTVTCPTCRGPAVYGAVNPWRPFCGQRCKQIDMGAWAAEDYRMPAAPPPDDLDERES